jgi:hypothetical protein
MRKQYKREDLGKGTRSKHPDVAAAFPTTEAVNEALRSLVQVAERVARPTTRSSGPAEKRRRASQAPRRRAG